MKILIGIQARTNSKRLPNKVLLEICGKRLIDYIINEAQEAASFINRQSKREGWQADCLVGLLVPTHDKMLRSLYDNKIPTFHHDVEDDVLTRYQKAVDEIGCDHVVRLTADCLFMESNVISRHIKTQLKKATDYASNVIQRTMPEGHDVEVISRRCLEHIESLAKTKSDREHVTISLTEDIRKNDSWYKMNMPIAHVLNKTNTSFLKLSIDTEEEFERARNNLESIQKAKQDSLRSGLYVI